MAGVCKPRAAFALVHALRQEIGLPVHFHTHDTSGISAASVLAAIAAGCDAVDGAMGSMSGLTSQPNLGSLAAALHGTEQDPGLNVSALQSVSDYWEGVRQAYQPFEVDMRAGTAEIYQHAMPGGQYTNLREQARALGLAHRWPEIARTYADVNVLFGDIVKVTPTSKVVGDMALFMVAENLSSQDVCSPSCPVAFPQSVVALMRGELGSPPGGFPQALQDKVLRGEKPIVGRPADHLPPADLEQERQLAAQAIGRPVGDADLASWLMYPKVFTEYCAHRKEYGDVSLLPTPAYFYGLSDREDISIDIEPGKTLLVCKTGGASGVDAQGRAEVFFELNGQPRTVRVAKAGQPAALASRTKADAQNPCQLGSPMAGTVVTVLVRLGERVVKGTALLSVEAMKMETLLTASRSATVYALHVGVGDSVLANDLVLELRD